MISEQQITEKESGKEKADKISNGNGAGTTTDSQQTDDVSDETYIIRHSRNASQDAGTGKKTGNEQKKKGSDQKSDTVNQKETVKADTAGQNSSMKKNENAAGSKGENTLQDKNQGMEGNKENPSHTDAPGTTDKNIEMDKNELEIIPDK